MEEQFLTLAQNTCAARIFLNTLGLILENVSDINQFSKIKIFDDKMQEVGITSFSDGVVNMHANYNGNILNAHFNLAKAYSLIDIEEKIDLFGEWSSNISFELIRQNLPTLTGEILIKSSMDTEFGVSCRVHPIINFQIPSGNVTLKLLRDGCIFELDIKKDNYHETIEIMPFDEINGFIKHVITNGEYNRERYQHEYRKYAGIFAAGKENDHKLHVFLLETNWDKQLNLINEYPTKVGNDDTREVVIQKGMLMQKLDYDMFNKIKQVKDILITDNVSILDNLISMCLNSYDDEQIKALLNLQTRPMKYQDGANNLIDSYFGIGKKKIFFHESIKKIQ